MPENRKAYLEFPKPFILDLAGHLKDAFLHTDIPTQADSMIPSDETFIQMARYLSDLECLEIIIHQPLHQIKNGE